MSRSTSFLAGIGTKIIQLAGSELTRRKILNFSGTGVTVVDNPSTGATDVTITAGGGTTDHQALTNRSSTSAHTQYGLLTGATCTGTWTWSSGNVSLTSGVVTATNIRRGTGSPDGVVSGNIGDIYQRTDSTGQLYRNDDGATSWVEIDAGASLAAYTSTPTNTGGVPGAGASADYARGDHKHEAGTLGSPIASAGTTDIGAATGDYVHITGTTTITSFGSNGTNGCQRVLTFDGALTLTHSSSLILPNATDVLTVAGQTAFFRRESVGVWRCVSAPPTWYS